MKKEYVNPEMEVVVVNTNQQLLAGSPSLGGDYGGSDILAPGLEKPEEILFDNSDF